MATKTEFRTLQGTNLRSADGDNDFALEGLCCPYDTDSAVMAGGPAGNFTERCAPGCFRNSLKAGGDVKADFNHEANRILGRTKNKTLRLVDTSAGLCFRVSLNRKNSDHVALYSSVMRGDVDACSFAFTVRAGGQKWSQDYSKRTLTDLDLLAVSIVTQPAYAATSVSARSAGGINRTAGGVYTADWRVAVALKLAKLDAQYEQTLRKLEGTNA